MNWNFHINEQSAGSFCADARRETGESVSLVGSELILPQVLQWAYNTERNRGTSHGVAAYRITSSFLESWSPEYHEKMMGCWTVGKQSGFPRIDYHGGDS
jgi:hypothetical protein